MGTLELKGIGTMQAGTIERDEKVGLLREMIERAASGAAENRAMARVMIAEGAAGETTEFGVDRSLVAAEHTESLAASAARWDRRAAILKAILADYER